MFLDVKLDFLWFINKSWVFWKCVVGKENIFVVWKLNGIGRKEIKEWKNLVY